MTVFTPVFQWPFQALNEPPDGPNLGEDLALAIENTVQGLQSRIVQLETQVSALNAFAANPGFTKIGEQILTSTATEILFSSIPQTFRHLELWIVARSNAAAAFDASQLQFNGDTAANYDSQQIVANGAAVGAFEHLGQTAMFTGEIAGATATANFPSFHIIEFPWYTNTSFHKTGRSHHGLFINTASGNTYIKEWTMRWRSTAAVTSLRFFAGTGPLSIGSSCALYGVA